MDYGKYDLTTQRYLLASDQLLSYTPNSLKFLKMHMSESKTRLILGGKRCLPGDYKILTSNGDWRLIKDISIGDEILSTDLKTLKASPARVVNKTSSGIKEIFKINLTDGTSCRASSEHNFPVFSRSGKTGSRGKVNSPIWYNVSKLIKSCNNSESKKKGLIQSREVNFGKTFFPPIDPYLLGVILGDGNITSNSPVITCENPEIIDEITPKLNSIGMKVTRFNDIQYRITNNVRIIARDGSQINILNGLLESVGLRGKNSSNKFIPQGYLTSSIEDRKKLLAGLIDTDGYIDGFTSKSKDLAEGFCFLVRSLGGKATLSEVNKTCCNNGKVGVYFNVYWRLSCTLPLKLSYKHHQRKLDINFSRRVIRNIESLGEEETFDITVDHTDHNFIGENWIVTGNSGKSTFGVVETCWVALGIHPWLDFPRPPLKIRVCTVDYNTGIKGIILPHFEKWLPKHAIRKYHAEDRILELTNGTSIDFKSYEQDLKKFEGTERHFIWMDEEPPKNIYQSNYMRTVSGGINGKMLITCTPLEGMNWLYDELYDNPAAKPPYVEWIHVPIYENPHLDKDAIEAIKHDPAMRDNLDAALYGMFVSKTGLIYKEFTSRHVIPPVKEINPGWMTVIGIDPHDRNPHGVVFVGLNRENEWIVFDEILEHCTIPELVKLIRAKLGKRFPPNLAIIDTSAHAEQSIVGRSVADELRRLGLNTLPAYKDWQAGVLRIKELLDPGKDPNKFKPRLKITENCTSLIREFRHYIWADWHRKGDKYNPKEMPLKKDDHLVDALRYVCMANAVYRPPDFKYKPKIDQNKVNPVTGYF